MNGAPSVQMQEIPPDLMGWLEEEERNAEEKEEEAKGSAKAGDTRLPDDHRARNEFFDGEKDSERDLDSLGGGGGSDDKPTSSSSSSRKAGGSGGSSGRSKGKGKGRD